MSLTLEQKKIVARLLWPRADIPQKSAHVTKTFLHSTYLGEGTATSFERFNATFPPESILYICPKCGVTWARIYIEDAEFIPELRPCPTHGPGILGLYGDQYTLPYKAIIHDLMAGLTPAQYQAHLLTRGK